MFFKTVDSSDILICLVYFVTIRSQFDLTYVYSSKIIID